MLNINIKAKYFHQQKIFENFLLQIPSGQFTAIIGPSGCGKSTLLNLICSLDSDFLGEITLDEKLPREDIGFLFQDSRLVPWLSVKQNLELVTKTNKEDKIFSLLAKVGLANFSNAFPSQLSGGMSRKVALCRAFINNPKLILLDEPFVSLDTPSAKELRGVFMDFYAEFKPTVVLVTHALTEALYLADRVVFLQKEPASIVYEFVNEKGNILDDKRAEVSKGEILEKYPKILEGKIQKILLQSKQSLQ